MLNSKPVQHDGEAAVMGDCVGHVGWVFQVQSRVG